MNAGNQAEDNLYRMALTMRGLYGSVADVPHCATCVFYGVTRFDEHGWGQCPQRQTIISRRDFACKPEYQPHLTGVTK